MPSHLIEATIGVMIVCSGIGLGIMYIMARFAEIDHKARQGERLPPETKD